MQLSEKENIARNIRTIRVMKGMTQGDLGKKIGTSQEYISLCECGREKIGIRSIKKIAAGLGVSAELLQANEIEVTIKGGAEDK